MTHKLINTGDYLLIVDDSEIKEGDWGYNPFADCPISVGDIEDDMLYINTEYSKIIAHLPLNNSPILEGVDLLPPLEDDVEKLADFLGFYDSTENNKGNRTTKAFIAGYNKAKEKYKYTEEDILIIRNKLVSMLPTGDVSAWDMIMSASNYTKWFDEFIQSLQQPKMPVGFKCEMVQKSVNGSIPVNQEWEYEPKTTTNSQGLTQWVGEYIY